MKLIIDPDVRGASGWDDYAAGFYRPGYKVGGINIDLELHLRLGHFAYLTLAHEFGHMTLKHHLDPKYQDKKLPYEIAAWEVAVSKLPHPLTPEEISFIRAALSSHYSQSRWRRRPDSPRIRFTVKPAQ